MRRATARRRAPAARGRGAGAVVWVTGPPAAGKSTFARRLGARLEARGARVLVLDGDAVRAALVPHPGYSERERADFYASLAGLAALCARQGLVVLVPATAHRREFRAHARTLAPAFVEVFLDVPEHTCVLRDPKGLYAAARAGGAPRLPGAGVAYERPEAPDVVASGGWDRRALEHVEALVVRPARVRRPGTVRGRREAPARPRQRPG